jgi:hypothetical protein
MKKAGLMSAIAIEEVLRLLISSLSSVPKNSCCLGKHFPLLEAFQLAAPEVGGKRCPLWWSGHGWGRGNFAP